MAAGGERLREGKRHRLRSRIECDLRARDLVKRCRLDREFERIEHQPISRLQYLDMDLLAALEGELVEIGRKLDLVVERNDGFRQLAGRRHEVRQSLGRRRCGERDDERNERRDEDCSGAAAAGERHGFLNSISPGITCGSLVIRRIGSHTSVLPAMSVATAL